MDRWTAKFCWVSLLQDQTRTCFMMCRFSLTSRSAENCSTSLGAWIATRLTPASLTQYRHANFQNGMRSLFLVQTVHPSAVEPCRCPCCCCWIPSRGFGLVVVVVVVVGVVLPVVATVAVAVPATATVVWVATGTVVPCSVPQVRVPHFVLDLHS